MQSAYMNKIYSIYKIKKTSALHTSKFCLVLHKAYKVRNKTSSPATLDALLPVLDTLLLIFPHQRTLHKYPTVLIHSRCTLLKKNSPLHSVPLPILVPLRRHHKQKQTTCNCSVTHPGDRLRTAAPEEQASALQSIMFPVARWMGRVPATSCNPFVMPIAGCYQVLH